MIEILHQRYGKLQELTHEGPSFNQDSSGDLVPKQLVRGPSYQSYGPESLIQQQHHTLQTYLN